jgi:hypothetical protein
VLIRRLIRLGHSEYEAAAHMITLGVPKDLAYARAEEALSDRLTH